MTESICTLFLLGSVNSPHASGLGRAGGYEAVWSEVGGFPGLFTDVSNYNTRRTQGRGRQTSFVVNSCGAVTVGEGGDRDEREGYGVLI